MARTLKLVADVQLPSHVTICNPMDGSMPGLPVPHHLPEFAQVHVHCTGDAVQPSCPLMPFSPSAPSLSQRQRLFQQVICWHQMTNILEFQLQHQSFQREFRVDFPYDWLVWSHCCPKDSQESFPAPQFKGINSLALCFLYGPALTTVQLDSCVQLGVNLPFAGLLPKTISSAYLSLPDTEYINLIWFKGIQSMLPLKWTNWFNSLNILKLLVLLLLYSIVGCWLVAKSCLTLCNPMDCSPPGWAWESLGKNTGAGCHFLLHGIFPTQGSNPCLLHCWQILYHWATREASFIQYILPKCLLPASPMAGTGTPRKTRYGSCHAGTEYSSARGWVSGQAPPGSILGGSGTLASAWHSVWAQIFVEEMLNKWLGNTQEGHLTQAQQW